MSIVAFCIWSVFFVILLTITFVPVIIANNRKHPQTALICILVILSFWTMIGWFIALIWALMPFDRVAELKTELTLSEKLAELSFLLENNILTQDEYNEKRKKILENF
jgi:hypothetical protein